MPPAQPLLRVTIIPINTSTSKTSNLQTTCPVVQHPEQDKAAQDKLASLAAKIGKKPNIVIFLLDDLGWWDPGFQRW